MGPTVLGLELDPPADAALRRAREHQRRGRGVLHGHADGLVEGDLGRRRAAGPAPGDELTQLGVDVARIDHAVADRPAEVVRSTGRWRDGGEFLR